jgi:hypothetical protein
MQESKAHLENDNFSIKNSDGLTVALNINVTYIKRKNYIIIHPSIHHYHHHTITTAAATATTITVTGRVCSTLVIRNAYILIRTAVCMSSQEGRRRSQNWRTILVESSGSG